MESPCAVSILATDDMLLVTLRYHADADRDAIECWMFQIVDVLALVERLSARDLQDLLWEQKQLSKTEHCVTLRRGFSDPEYPQKFDAVFRRLGDSRDEGRWRHPCKRHLRRLHEE
jgi:hypothetical protein